MSTRTRPTEEIIQAARDESLVPLGEYSAQDGGSGLRLWLPTVAQESLDADVGDDFESWFDQETGAIVFLPAE
ncbi:hypothetical protein [Halorhabdus amylolytica]|uniref:hypothetical protein n=1 Tax=Halorhabdus amylolytica TaxID=2559573 RepID=UPI0010AA88F8|nr:hypothetical protein [Halorhabdus amylolytica]